MQKDTHESLSQDSIDSLYAVAHCYYADGHYAKAEDCFRLLTLQGPKEKKHWLGLAACYQMQSEYQKALEAYAYAANFDDLDASPHLHAAECFFHLNDLEAAEIACSEAEKRIPNLAKKDQDSRKVRLEWIRMACKNLSPENMEMSE